MYGGIPREASTRMIPIMLGTLLKEVPDNPIDLIVPLERSEEITMAFNMLHNPEEITMAFNMLHNPKDIMETLPPGTVIGVNLSKEYPGLFYIGPGRR